MSDIWMGIAPEPKATRVIAMAGPSETILKARLLPSPRHPRAMATLLEALAMWQGTKVRAVVSVDERDGACDSDFYREVFTDFGGPLYTLDWVPACRRGLRCSLMREAVERDYLGVAFDHTVISTTFDAIPNA